MYHLLFVVIGSGRVLRAGEFLMQRHHLSVELCNTLAIHLKVVVNGLPTLGRSDFLRRGSSFVYRGKSQTVAFHVGAEIAGMREGFLMHC